MCQLLGNGGISMSIIDRLSLQIPKSKKRSPLNPQYQLTRKYLPEIEKAREIGYSWPQICTAVAEDATECGQWNKQWSSYAIQEIYRKIKKEQASA